MSKISVKHTPGPWIINRRNLEINGQNGKAIADPIINEGNEVARANAALIAAAPELLSVLKTVKIWLGSDEENTVSPDDIFLIVDDAIAKAEAHE